MFRSGPLRPLEHSQNIKIAQIYRPKTTQASPSPPVAHPTPRKIPQLSDLTPSPYRLAVRRPFPDYLEAVLTP